MISQYLQGDLVTVRVLGQNIIIINSAKAAQELLGKRSYNFSDRPRIPILELYVTQLGYCKTYLSFNNT
jgi:hypothetical protein